MAVEKIVRLDESAIGSTLTRDVRGEGTALICSAGDRLSGRLVLKLKRAGISSVYVKRELIFGERESVAKRLSQLDRRFARVEKSAVMHALKAAIAEKMKEKARGGT